MAAGEYSKKLFALLEGLGAEDKIQIATIIGGVRNEIKGEFYAELARLRHIESCARYLLSDIKSQRNWQKQLDEALEMKVEDYESK
jgi:hypothetical protein